MSSARLQDFLETTKRVCEQRVLDPKWLVAPNRRIGNQWKDQVNFSGTNSVNLHIETLPSIVLRLISSELAARQCEFATGFRCTLLVGKILGELLADEKLAYLDQVQSDEKLAQLVAKTIKDFRLADLSPEQIVSSELEDSEKANDIREIVSLFDQELVAQNLLDYSGCLKLAIELLNNQNGADKQIIQSLPESLVVLIPVEVANCHLENCFLECLRQNCEVIFPDESNSEIEYEFNHQFRTAIGEVNEVQSVLQDVIENADVKLDQVEILHPDYSVYVPLIYETLATILETSEYSLEELPVTFGEGIACIYSRPGRALRSWLRWIEGDYLQTIIVQMIREGLLQFDDDQVGIGFANLAHRLRKLPIGLGRSRYSDSLKQAINDANLMIANAAKRAEDSDNEHVSSDYDFGLSAFEKIRETIVPLVDAAPKEDAMVLDVLAAAKVFLECYARCTSKFDQYAKNKLLDDIMMMQQAIEVAPDFDFKIYQWLKDLAVESRILASSPRPGCLHIDHIAHGGHSGRARTYLVGLDDSRFPLRGGQDPLLLDFERKNLSENLWTSGNASIQSVKEYNELLNRLSGDVFFSYTCYSLSDDHELFPSSALLDTFREVTNKPTGSLEDFQIECGVPSSFCQSDPTVQLKTDQWWMKAMADKKDSDERIAILENQFRHFYQPRIANENREGNSFTQYDGLVPQAGKDLDPTLPDARRVSSSRLETFGVCPRKFFFRYGLQASPPEEHTVDSEQWLDPLTLGSLIHDLFENFLRDLTSENRIPDLSNDLDALRSMLHQKIDELKKEVPIPNEDAFQRQLQRLEKTCEIFLRKEEEYCRANKAVPWVFEASIGLQEPVQSEIDFAEPVPLKLSDGRVIHVGGRIDRIDRICKDGVTDSLNFAIWDYKSGSDWGFDVSEPLKEGRKLQPFIYVGMLKHRLVAELGAKSKVNYFGYFFPSPKTEGLRLQWTPEQLASGDEILRHICDLISSGTFISTTNSDDCRFCEYLPVCGDEHVTQAAALMKLESCSDKNLDAMRAIRGIKLNHDLNHGGKIDE